MAITFRLAQEEDAVLAISLQNQAFFEDYKRFGMCPSYDRKYEQMLWIINHNQYSEKNLSEESETTEDSRYYDYLIYEEDLPVGNIIIKVRNGIECHVSSLCVITSKQNQGIGSKALAFLEETFHYCDTITLDTPADKEENLIFYMKNGFHVVGEVKSCNIWCTLFEKKIKDRT